MSAPLKILHLADTHIGAELPTRPRRPGPRRGDDFINAYLRVLQIARDENVDLVIHAGDVYDTPRPSSSAVLAAVMPLRRLADDGIPVLIVPGNHERSLLPASPFLSHPNITIAGGPMTRAYSFRGVRVAVSAWPCIRREASVRFGAALAETGWRDIDADFRILAVHQSFDSAVCGPANHRFSKKNPDVISREAVPFEFDYLAAGHVHRHQFLRPATRLTPRIVYAGSPDRITFAEKDEPKGCVLIEEVSCKLHHRFIEHAVRPMSVWPIAVEGLSRERLISRIEELIAGLPEGAVADIRVAGVADRQLLRGIKVRERAAMLRPDVLPYFSVRGIDFPDQSPEQGISPISTTSPPAVSAFDVIDPAPAHRYVATAGNLATLPQARGVYAIYDREGRLLYVGKATNLRARVQTHMRDSAATNYFSGWTRQAARIETVLVSSDEAALDLETSLIRRHRPPFNWFGT
ncbi:MAG: metallophosphoesterase [Phycisphaerae bacterium]|nr:metallophosphoesterase [Phycisphaerae bacterium]